jgi:hypothetical protein
MLRMTATRTTSYHRLGLVALAVCASQAFACSGPGAADAIRRNRLAGVLSVGLVATIILISVLLNRRYATASPKWYSVLLVVFHPHWYLSAGGGDCGYFLRDTSLFFSGAALGILATAVKSALDHGLGVSNRQISLRSLLIISVAFGCAGFLKFAFLVQKASILWSLGGFLAGIGVSMALRTRSKVN